MIETTATVLATLAQAMQARKNNARLKELQAQEKNDAIGIIMRSALQNRSYLTGMKNGMLESREREQEISLA